ncbi:hypothetical protein [Streptomyces nodosus]|uniref:hypothetical protein n=1 Tax=Streptomyces nodosus TaxID=40318 RepID=UPI00381CDFF3
MSQPTKPQPEPQPEQQLEPRPEPSRVRRLLLALARRAGDALLKAAAEKAVSAVLAVVADVIEHYIH